MQVWIEYRDAFDFPHRMNVSTSGSMAFPLVETSYVDFETGIPVPGWVPPAQENFGAAVQRFLDLCVKYEDMILPGFEGFPDKDSIPEDLVMPFRDLVEKYDLADAVPQLWDATAMGLGNTMDVPSMFVMQGSGLLMARSFLGQAHGAIPASGRLYDLYDAVADFLGDDVLYSSTIVSAWRHDDGVHLTVKGADGKITCIKAKRLVVAAQPTPETMKPLKLDKQEQEIFDKLGFSTVYAGIVKHPSLHANRAYHNRSPKPGSTDYLVWPEPSQVGLIDWIGDTDDIFTFTAVGTSDDNVENMKRLVRESVDNMVEAGTLEDDGELEFLAVADHGKMHVRISEEDLRAGFVQKQLALQGHRSTWYTGAAFSAQFTTVLWEYNKVLLPEVIKGI